MIWKGFYMVLEEASQLGIFVEEMIGTLISIAAEVVDRATKPWRRLFWFSLHMYFTAWSIALTLAFRTLTAPFRILNAARREKVLESELHELQTHYDELCEKKSDLEKQLEYTRKDRKRIKESLDQAVAEWEVSIEKLKLLKARVQELEAQNSRLKQIEEEQKKKEKLADDVALKDKYSGLVNQVFLKAAEIENWDDDNALSEGRGVALSSSIFSAVLSTLVGVIAWEAQDPCMPLVVALFIVVGMSLANVAQFFSKLQSRYGFDAVALLSFNWFMLGTLAFPAFPYVARAFSPIAIEVGTWFAGWFGFT